MTRGNKKYVSLSYYCSNKPLGLCEQKSMSERFMEQLFLKQLEKINIEPDILKDISTLEEETPSTQKIIDLEHELELLKKDARNGNMLG